ncbi:MAG TPA: RodZ domain-containing protein [Gaiellaceae bacterium]|nr:RodZ domain-containing protein [Gaiellaceae bacterium]
MFEIGNSLREARVRKELDFPELEQGTKIRAKYLRALEDENFDQLPAPTYVKGFLRAYADYLGLDGQLYVDEYTLRYASGDEVLERRIRGSSSSSSRRPRPRQRRLESRVVWLALLGIAAVTALVIAAWRFGGSGHQSLPLSTAAATPPARVPTGLVVKAVKGDSLLIVRTHSASGRQQWNGTLTRGEAQRFDVKRGLWVYIGSPENVAMKLNGTRVTVGGAKPRSLIVTSGNVVPAGPGT